MSGLKLFENLRVFKRLENAKRNVSDFFVVVLLRNYVFDLSL